MNIQEAVNFGLNKLGSKEIWENQRKVVEAYFNDPDALKQNSKGQVNNIRKSAGVVTAVTACRSFLSGIFSRQQYAN